MCSIGGSAVATERTRLGRDPPPTVLKQLNCVGTETNIAQCTEIDRECLLLPGTGVICPLQNGKYKNNIFKEQCT